jgi:BirA family biotin operon repressor/biotin-[acetyl-CoA-carboxylase] ligase
MTAEQTQALRAEQAAREAGIDAPLTFHEVVESTNTTALRLAEDGCPEWSVVVAGHQTDGRGRLGRTWIAQPGDALLCSVVLRPESLGPQQAGLLTLLAGVAMTEAARVACRAAVTCKWPNDIMVGKGKAGGILAESIVVDGRLRAVVIGAGVNVRAAPPGIKGAAALGTPADDPSKLLTAFLFCMKQRYRPGDDAFGPTVLSAYREVCSTLGGNVRATTLDGRSIEGLAADVDERGNLLVDGASNEGQETVAFGEVEHLER